MRVPSEFKDAMAGLHQDSLAGVSSLAQLAGDCSQFCKPEWTHAVVAFLDELLGGAYTSGEIRSAFEKSKADVRFRRTEDIVIFLQEYRKAIQE